MTGDNKKILDNLASCYMHNDVTDLFPAYLKLPEPLNGAARASSMQDTWLIVGGIILACILLLVAAAFLACFLGGRRKGSGGSRVLREASHTANNTMAKENMAYQGEKDGKVCVNVLKPSFI